MEIDRNGLEVLDRPECLRLLSTATVGRIAITFSALPVILPVNFRVVSDRIVFRTGIGTKLDAATCNAVVAFEVDQIDPVSATGWSVVVTGIAREITDLEAIEGCRTDVPRWAPTSNGRWVEITTEVVSGRRVLPLPGAASSGGQ